jgi:cytochrome c oxidase subunit IV
MSQDYSARLAAGDQIAIEDDPHHGPTVKVYLIVFAWLMLLLVITLAAAAFDLGSANIFIAITIAVIKAVLVMLFFMHLRYSTRLVWVFAGAGFFWLTIMFFLTMSDYHSRNWLPAAATQGIGQPAGATQRETTPGQ